MFKILSQIHYSIHFSRFQSRAKDVMGFKPKIRSTCIPRIITDHHVHATQPYQLPLPLDDPPTQPYDTISHPKE